jgi:hypothetical protein
MKRIRSRNKRQGAALYVSVMATAMIVTLLGLAGLQITRIERGQMTQGDDRKAARRNANSAVELALRVMANDPNWRTTYSSGVETPRQSLGREDAGQVSWILEDADGNLNNVDLDLKLKGLGRAGDALQVSTLALKSGEVPVGPLELRSMTNHVSLSDVELDNDLWLGQYLRPNLPANATRWWVTSVEILCKRDNSSRTFRVRLYEPLATNWPSTTIIDEVSIDSNSIGSLFWAYHTFNLSGSYALKPDQGICLALETSSSSSPIELLFRTSGVTELHSALIAGTPAWNFYSSSMALCYRVHGIYQVPSSEAKPITATWVWDAAP